MICGGVDQVDQIKKQENTKSENYQEKYIENLYKEIIGLNLKFNTPYGEKNVIYSDYTASGRGMKKIEEFITNQVLPFYANVHSSCGYLAEQSENFRIESKMIVRRYLNTDEKDSIIFAGQGTTSCVNKLIKLMNLKEYVNFYQSLKELSENYGNMVRLLSDNKINISQIENDSTNVEEKEKECFLLLNAKRIEEVVEKYVHLFQIANFCYLNRWGSYDCILCRMTFLQESQYNEHETKEVHLSNLQKCAKFDNTLFKTDIKFDLKEKDFIFKLMQNYQKFEPVILLSILEHNSNALPWRESGAKTVYIGLDNSDMGRADFDYEDLERQLVKYSENYIKMGSFTAASNISGVYLDVDYISLIMHKHHSLVFFDYATASPYVKIDMNKPLSPDYRKALGFTRTFTSEEETLIYKDSLFFSPHKLLGGPNTPGVLIIKQHVVRNLLIPSEPGGGVVLFVRKEQQNYVKNIEAREESGTPDIIGSVRIGLSLLMREKVDDMYILKKEEDLNKLIMTKLQSIPNLFVLGNTRKRIPIYSFAIKFNGKILHHNFVAALLNDLFGIQSRPGCSCASTYGQLTLGLEEDYVEKLEKLVCTGNEIFRPGYVRLNFPYFYPDHLVDYILSSIDFVARYGWLFLSHYAFKVESGKYYHRNEDEEKRKWLNDISFTNGQIDLPDLSKIPNFSESDPPSKKQLQTYLESAFDIVKDIKNVTKHIVGKSKLNLKILFTDVEELRWFLLPDDLDTLFYNIDLDSVLTSGNQSDINTADRIKRATEEPLVVKFSLSKESSNEHYSNQFQSKQTINPDDNTKISLSQTVPTEFQEVNVPDPKTTNKILLNSSLFPEIPKKILKLVGQASKDFDMLKEGDKILVGMSGGKDSTSLLHILLYFQRKVPFKIEIAGVTVDPQSDDYNPSPLIEYMKKLGVKYFYEKDPILERAKTNLQKDSICAYCARMKRGIIYNCARREGYNVIALGQHLDDLAESFLMSSFHNGLLRTMKANYIIDQGDLRVIRPLIYCREKLFKEFTLKNNLPIIQENCPACFSAPKERHRVKVLLAQQENMFPNLFSSLQKAMVPLMKGLIESSKKDDLEI